MCVNAEGYIPDRNNTNRFKEIKVRNYCVNVLIIYSIFMRHLLCTRTGCFDIFIVI